EAALKAQTFGRAAVLIEQSIGPHHFYGLIEYHTLRRWLCLLPEATLARHPKLCLRLAMILMFSSDCQAPVSLEPVEPPLRMAESFWQAEDNRSGLGEVRAFRALMAYEQGDLALAASLARQALAWLPEHEQQWRGTCLSFIGQEQLLAGELLVARQSFLE